jgi:Palmitoyl protein thioesterase
MQQIDEYLKGCRFLPKLNNEKAEERNSTYKERFSSLQNLVLIMVVTSLSCAFFFSISNILFCHNQVDNINASKSPDSFLDSFKWYKILSWFLMDKNYKSFDKIPFYYYCFNLLSGQSRVPLKVVETTTLEGPSRSEILRDRNIPDDFLV